MNELDEKIPASPFVTARRYGLIGGLILVGYFLITTLTGYYTSQEWYVTLVNVIVYTGVFFFISHKSITSYRDEELNGVINFGKAFGVSALACLVTILILTVFTYIFIKFIDRSILDQLREVAMGAMEEQDLDDEEYEQANKMMGLFMGPGMMAITTLFTYGFWAAAVAAVTSAIVPKNNTNLGHNQ